MMTTPEKPKKSKTGNTLILALLALLIGLFILGFLPRYFQRQEVKREAAQLDLPIVRTMQVTDSHKVVHLVLPTSLEAIRVTPIWARTNGYISELKVDIGDKVKEGQLLVLIDTPEVDQQLNQSRADLLSFIAKEEIARVSAVRWQELYKHNPEAISTQEVDERSATYHSAQADTAAARANVERLEKIQNFQRVVAPFDGVITQRDIDLGTLISEGSSGNPQELFRIAKTDILRAFVNVPQTYYRSIQDGLPAQISLKEFPQRLFHGIVVRNARALDPAARTLLTQVDVDNKDDTLMPGLYAEVQFELKPDVTRFTIPTDALIIRTGVPQVAVVDTQHVVHLHNVKIGHDFGSHVEIIDGLHEADVIVINPNERIKEGTKVQIADK